MFGKKKKEKKVEKVFETADSQAGSEQQQEEQKSDAAIDEEILLEQAPEQPEEETEEKENDRLSSVKEKISKILQSSNIEIVDENEGDEFDTSSEGAEKSQQDYDSLKAIFGSGEKNKKNELTLSIDDFDYTYAGKYVEEYDILHLKNIKKIKMQRKHSKAAKKLIIAAAALLVVGVGITLGVILTRKTPVYLESISLSQTEMNIFKDMSFKYDNIYILAHYSNGEVDRIKLTDKYLTDSTGFVESRPDGSIVFSGGEQATLVFTYSGLKTSMKINILAKEVDEENPLKVLTAPSLSHLNEGDYITDKKLIILVHYTNTIFEYEKVDLSNVSIRLITDSGATHNLSYDSEKKGFLVPVNFDSSSVGESSYLEITYNGSKINVSI